MKNVPRIRARACEIIDPPEHKGKWAFEISVWTMDGTTQIGKSIGPYGPYPTEADAIRESKKAAQLACEAVEKRLGYEPSGKFLDLKNGAVLRSWNDN